MIGRFLGEETKGIFFEEAIKGKIFENKIAGAITICDTDFGVQSWNQSAKEVFDWAGKEIMGKPFCQAAGINIINETKDEAKKRLFETGHWEGHMRRENSNGEWQYMHTSKNIISDSHGNPSGIVIVSRDVTANREVEEALKLSEQRLKLAGQAAYDLLYEWEPATGVLTWFGDVDKLLGFEEGTVSHSIEAWLALIHPEDREILEQAVVHHSISTEPIEYEYRIRHAEGHYLHWWDHALPILNEEGRPINWIGVCVDKTKQAKMIKALEDRDKLLSTIGENFPKAYLSVIYPDLTVGYTNGQGFKLRGIDPKQFEGLNTRDVFSGYGEEILETILTRYHKTLDEGIPQIFELCLNGEIQQYSTVPIHDEEGKIVSMLAVVRDVTEERQKEIKIRESEEKFSKAFKDHAVPMKIIDTKTKELIDINNSFINLTGFEAEELTDKGWDVLEYCIDKECIDHVISILGKDKKLHNYPSEIKTKDGQIRNLILSGSMLEVGTGDLAILSLVDVTLKNQAEASLRDSESRLKTLIETLPDLFWLKDPDGVYLACNKRFSSLYDAPEEVLKGKTDKDFVSPDVADFFRQNDLAAIELGGPRKNEEVLTFQSDGHVEHVETIKAPIYSQEGELIGVMGIARDITTRIHQMETLRMQNEVLKNIAWMQSHEVRAPLSNIIGLIPLLELDTPPNDEERKFIHDQILKQAHKLDSIIREIISKTEEFLWTSEKIENVNPTYEHETS